MDTPAVTGLAEKLTVVMVARERLTTAPRALASLIATIPAAVPLIVVEGASPAETSRRMDELCAQRPFVSLRFDYYLLPPEARNRALELVKTPYVVFVDNDIEFERGWLENLLLTAETRKVAAVAPLTMIRVTRGGAPKEYVHHAGGTIAYVTHRLRLSYACHHREEWKAVDDPSIALLSRQSENLEFHTFLIRVADLRMAGGFDERLVICDHDDLSMRLHAMGRGIAFCPDAKICYDATGRIETDDLNYFIFRWSRAKIALSCTTYERNWRVSQYFAWEWASRYRKAVLAPLGSPLFRRLPQPLFDLYYGWLRLKSRNCKGERNRRKLGPRHECPPPPKEVVRFYRERLKNRDCNSPFPSLPPELLYPPSARGGALQPAE